MLAREGIDFVERLHFTEPVTAAEVKKLARLAGGVEHLVSTRSPAYRELKLAGQELSEAEWVKLFQSEPRLLRRPIVTDGKRIVIGYDEAAIRELIAAQ